MLFRSFFRLPRIWNPMSFDGFFLHHMVQELKAELLSGRIQKINQPFEQEAVQ